MRLVCPGTVQRQHWPLPLQQRGGRPLGVGNAAARRSSIAFGSGNLSVRIGIGAHISTGTPREAATLGGSGLCVAREPVVAAVLATKHPPLSKEVGGGAGAWLQDLVPSTASK